MTDTDLIPTLLSRDRIIAVVGLSPRPERASYAVSQYMQRQGYRIVPVNPRAAALPGGILGQPCYADLHAAATALAREGLRIDMVNCFRRANDIPPIVDEAIEIGARSVWMQLGIVNEEAAGKARAAGLDVVMDCCVKIEHARWLAAQTV